MASENKSTAVNPPTPPIKGPSLSDTQARDQFIAVALREIVRHQVAENKYNAAMAGTWAVRFANETMIARAGETTPLNVVVAKSTVTANAVPTTPPARVEDGEKPKSIAEIIGEAEPVEEVK